MTTIESVDFLIGKKRLGCRAGGVWQPFQFPRRGVVIIVSYLLVQTTICVVSLANVEIIGSLDPSISTAGEASDPALVKNLSALHGRSYGRPGLSHLTVAGAVHHGMKEVEMWLQTFAPGSGTPIHRHDCEEIFLVLKGKGTLYLASSTNSPFPGKPQEYSIEVNSTFTIPVNAVHQIRNSDNVEDLQHLAVISRPPIRVFTYPDWTTPHVEAREVYPYPWDEDLRVFSGNECKISPIENFG